MSAGQLARLCPKTGAWEFGGGRREISQEEIMGAMAACPNRLSEALIRAKYCKDPSMLASCKSGSWSAPQHDPNAPLSVLQGYWWDLCQKRGWHPHHERDPRLAELAIMETIYPSQCAKCRGRREEFSPKERDFIRCPRCGGEGTVTLSQRERAAFCYMDSRNWARRYDERLTLMIGYLSEEISHGLWSIWQSITYDDVSS